MTTRARRLAAGGALAVQFAVLYLPRAPSTGYEGLALDKLVHVLVFALPTLALIRVGVARGTVITLMVVQSVASELVQHVLLPGRSGDTGDLLADLAGVLIGVFAARGVRPRPRPAAPRSDGPSHRAAPS